MTIRPLAAALLALSLAATGCATDGHNHAGMGHSHDHAAIGGQGAAAHGASHVNMWASVNRAVAVIYPTKGNQVSGTLTFTKAPAGGVRIQGSITGLEPRSVHAMHIHEFGDQSSDDGSAAGTHYNPEGHQHGDVNSPVRHAGDLGNVTADETGKVTLDLTVKDLTLADLKNPVIGRGVVIHTRADDFSQPVGNAGGRLGVGVIGVAKNP